MSDITLGEFLKELAALLTEQAVPMPFENERPWHLLFYTLQRETADQQLPFLHRLTFNWDGPYPKCHALSEFLHALHWNAGVTARNPYYDRIDSEISKMWKTRFDSQSAEVKEVLSAAMQIAQQEFSPMPAPAYRYVRDRTWREIEFVNGIEIEGSNHDTTPKGG